MDWISIKESKPKDYTVCLVCNNRYGLTVFWALYIEKPDCFQMVDPERNEHAILDVTHWIEIPKVPKL